MIIPSNKHTIGLSHIRALLFAAVLISSACPSRGVAQSKADCLACHGDESLTTERNGSEVSLHVKESTLNTSTHKKLVCVSCHTGFNPENIPHKETITPVKCVTCHQNAPAKHSFHPQLREAFASNQEPDVTCKDCHGTHDVASLKTPESKFHASRLVESCGDCHGDASESFMASAHGMSKTEGAPDCLSCHRNSISEGSSGHDTLGRKIRQEKMCLSCHLDDERVRSRMGPDSSFIAAYERSVHGAALLRGNASAANCVDCHGGHEVASGLSPISRLTKSHLVQVCATCHADVADDYAGSVHGGAVARGVSDAPVCTDCHGEHEILAPSDPNARVAPANVSGQVCSPCHSSVQLSNKYGIASDRFTTFSDSYHGLALRSGSLQAANCASCHGAHNIKRSSDSTSTIHRTNLATTCGKCHPGANEKFAMGAVHVASAQPETNPLLYWISTGYLILIIGTVGGMFAHNALDFLRKSKRTLRERRAGFHAAEAGRGLYLRMTLNERVQHGTLMVSFILLVVTGFMLRYPEAWWVEWSRAAFGAIFDLRGLIHRVAAGAMIAASLYHLWYVLGTVRGRRLMKELLPRIQDVRDAVASAKYNLGMSAQKPLFGRFGYVEKSEYWALVWGTLVMAITGVVMWFDNTFMGLLTKLGYDVARTIHFYEAWLATLSIIVWHLYFVIFNPDVYPMNLAWIKGTISESEMAEDHPLELQAFLRPPAEVVDDPSATPGKPVDTIPPGKKDRT